MPVVIGQNNDLGIRDSMIVTATLTLRVTTDNDVTCHFFSSDLYATVAPRPHGHRDTKGSNSPNESAKSTDSSSRPRNHRLQVSDPVPIVADQHQHSPNNFNSSCYENY